MPTKTRSFFLTAPQNPPLVALLVALASLDSCSDQCNFANTGFTRSSGKGHGKLNGILNFDSRPGKVMQFRKMCSCHGKVIEFQIYISLVLTEWLINKQTFETLQSIKTFVMESY